MTFLRLVGAAVLALLLIVNVVATAPARLLSRVVPGDQLVMRGLSGTVWDGSASGVLLRLPQGYLQLGAVQWSLHPMSLLVLAPRLTVHSEWGNQTLEGELVLRGQRDLDVLNMEGNVAASLLSHFAPVAISGMFNLQLEQLQLRDGLPYSTQGRLVWQEGSWRSPRGPVALGSYAMDIAQSPGEMLKGKVITLSGPLEADGELQLQQRHYQLDIALSSEGAMDEQLQQMLSLIAVPEGAGFRMALKGDF
ncbi:MAG: type II secretion system protein N [Halioglobus sp.]